MAEWDDIMSAWPENERESVLMCPGSILIEQLTQHFATKGFCRIPSLVGVNGIEALVTDSLGYHHLAHRSEEEVNPSLESPDEVKRLNTQETVRSTMGHFLLRVVAYDQLRENSLLTRLYLNDSLLEVVRAITAKPHLERFGDALGAVNLTFMTEGDKVPWHFDHSGYVLSLALTRPCAGGEFEIVAKSEEDRGVIARRMLEDNDVAVNRFAIDPGSAILFNGERCLHRVRVVEGDEPRTVALFGYDIDPEAHATAEANLGRYGRKF